jgi:AraC-like DNA-binding protein
MDVLTDVLAATRVAGSVTAQVTAAAPWGIRLPDEPTATFHAVVEGTCWLRHRGADPVQLVAGDVTLLGQGGAHVLASSRHGAAMPYADVLAFGRRGPHEIRLPGPGPETRVICGGYQYDAYSTHPLLSVLPPVLHVRTGTSPQQRALGATVRALALEISAEQAGGQTIVDRLIDVIFVHILRCAAAEREEVPWWLTALSDPQIALTLSAIHAEPGRKWTIEELAAQAGVARATLARRFTALVGEPPLAYLTRWRMELAARQLRTGDDPLSVIARRVGYESEFAFSRAFSRTRAIAPSRYRAQLRGGSS